MTKDRLKALQSVVQEDEEEGGGEDNIAIEIDDENAGYMERFYYEISQTRTWIDEITENVSVIKSLHSTLLSSPRPDEGTKTELEGRTNQVKALSKKISTTLKGLEKEIWQEEDELNPAERIPARLRIRRTQHAATLHLFLEAMSLFNNQQTEYREKCIERIHRLASIAKAVVSDEKIDELLEQGNYGAIFNDDIITETIEARRALEDVQVRHQELIKIEKSLVELRDLFVEMALLVEQQGDLINRIESHVGNTTEYVYEAHREMKKAIEYQRKSRTKLIIICCVVLVLLLILALVLWYYLKPSSSS